jgi:hypothetical protein
MVSNTKRALSPQPDFLLHNQHAISGLKLQLHFKNSSLFILQPQQQQEKYHIYCLDQTLMNHLYE